MKVLDTSVAVDHLRGLPADADLLTTNVRHFPMLTGLEPPY